MLTARKITTGPGTVSYLLSVKWCATSGQLSTQRPQTSLGNIPQPFDALTEEAFAGTPRPAAVRSTVKFALGSFLALGIIIGVVVDHYAYRQVGFLLYPQRSAGHLLVPEATLNHIKSRNAFFQHNRSEAAVIMLGDSITEYGGDWSELLDTPALNRGIASDTAEGMLVRLDEVIGRRPKIVALMAGINEIRSGVPVDLVAARIEQILTKLKAANVQPVMQSTLLTGAQLDEPNTNMSVISLNRALSQWCASQDFLFIDLNVNLAPDGVLDPNITIDGIHLNDAGYLRWRDVLDPLLHHLLDS
jgi:lysophospholipase L1-like esterase